MMQGSYNAQQEVIPAVTFVVYLRHCVSLNGSLLRPPPPPFDAPGIGLSHTSAPPYPCTLKNDPVTPP